ncbi:hypothetical protein FISHEDRAFT_37920 [Fistulina hepatica ATCC 64428]|nr:hypothetical protein FISHEDRAFT_37920 [Fistulina hepatica ATCC 64428]
MSEGLSLVSINLATFALESVFYGIFLVLACLSVGLQLIRNSSPTRSGSSKMRLSLSAFKRPMTIGAVLLVLVVTAHWLCTVIRSFDAFVYFYGGTQPLLYYADLAQTTEVVKTGLIISSILICDSFIIYRLWLVYDYNYWVIILPCMSWSGLVACGVGVTYQFSQYYIGLNVFNSSAGRWITSDCVLTLFTNIYSTILISYRIWSSYKRVGSMAGSSLLPALTIFVESAAITTIWAIFFLVSYEAKSNLQFTAVDVFAEISGIAFMMIHVRVGMGWAQKAASHSANFANQTSVHFVRNHPHSSDPLQINISSVVSTEGIMADSYNMDVFHNCKDGDLGNDAVRSGVIPPV